MRKILFLVDAPIDDFRLVLSIRSTVDVEKSSNFFRVLFDIGFCVHTKPFFVHMILFSSSYEPVIASPGGAFLHISTYFLRKKKNFLIDNGRQIIRNTKREDLTHQPTNSTNPAYEGT